MTFPEALAVFCSIIEFYPKKEPLPSVATISNERRAHPNDWFEPSKPKSPFYDLLSNASFCFILIPLVTDVTWLIRTCIHAFIDSWNLLKPSVQISMLRTICFLRPLYLIVNLDRFPCLVSNGTFNWLFSLELMFEMMSKPSNCLLEPEPMIWLIDQLANFIVRGLLNCMNECFNDCFFVQIRILFLWMWWLILLFLYLKDSIIWFLFSHSDWFLFSFVDLLGWYHLRLYEWDFLAFLNFLSSQLFLTSEVFRSYSIQAFLLKTSSCFPLSLIQLR
jgi:hypothetical protein